MHQTLNDADADAHTGKRARPPPVSDAVQIDHITRRFLEDRLDHSAAPDRRRPSWLLSLHTRSITPDAVRLRSDRSNVQWPYQLQASAAGCQSIASEGFIASRIEATEPDGAQSLIKELLHVDQILRCAAWTAGCPGRNASVARRSSSAHHTSMITPKSFGSRIKPADALLQGDHRLRDLLFKERIAAATLDRIQTRLEHRVIRRGGMAACR